MHGQKNIIFFYHYFSCKKTSWVELRFEKKKVCIPRSFLVINVCNQGKTLCSPCISVLLGAPHINGYVRVSFRCLKTTNAAIYTLITLSYGKIFLDKSKIKDSVVQVVQRYISTEFKWSSISRISLASHSHFTVFSFHKVSSKAISQSCSADVGTGLLRKYLEHMELADHQWLQKLYFMWDVTFHVNLLIYKSPTTIKKSLAFERSAFTQQISLCFWQTYKENGRWNFKPRSNIRS
jgi:hypothetical protein